MTVILEYGLIIWFICSIYFVANDKTLSINLKIIGVTVNILSMIYLFIHINYQLKSILMYLLGSILLMWYLYFTPQDIINQGYGLLEKISYVVIDICMILILFLSLTNVNFYINYNSALY